MPGLILHTSNQLDILAEHLSRVVSTRLDSPFAPETVVVQSLASRRWLSFQMASLQGICANYEFPFLANFVADIVRQAHPVEAESATISPEILAWKIDSILPSCLERREFASVAKYLQDGDSLKRFHLASRLANLFDQYRVYRPEMVAGWARPKDNHIGDEAWQATLWRELGEAPGFDQALERLRTRGFKKAAPLTLPERVSLFAPTSLPPAYLELLFQLSRVREVHLFLLRPSMDYRGNDPTAKQRARLGLTASDPEVGNPLLTSWGKIDADLTDLLLDKQERMEIAVEDGSEEFKEFQPVTLLDTIKSDILNARNRGTGSDDGVAAAPVTAKAKDRSLAVHACHSPMREVEILYDQLLDCFETMPDLRPRDILVMTPEIEKYAPYIRGVFGYPESEDAHIPYSVADRHPRSESQPIDTFLTLLDLPGSRYTAPQIFALLGSRALRTRFDFKDEDLSLIRDWIEETAIRWGVDGADRARAGLPALDANTWRHGLSRLLLGYAMPGEKKDLFEGILPHDEVEGDGGAVLGRFISATEALFRLTETFEHARPLAEWVDPLLEMVEQFLKPTGEEELRDVRFLRTIIDRLRAVADSVGTRVKVDFRVVHEHLAEQLAAMEQRGQFFRGYVTFCALKPVRSIPARVVCLLGINDQVFPRRPQPSQFDLMARSPRVGDPSVRQDDRYAFLETILSAREKLFISYVGRSAIHNNEIPPSVVVSELFDYLDQAFVFPKKKSARDFVLTEHPLQAFSPRYFSAEAGDERFFSYSLANAGASRSISARQVTEMPPFIADPLPPMEETNGSVELRDLIAFWKNPSRYFVRKRLGLSLWENDDCLSDIEPFEVDHLERYHIKEELLANDLETGEMLSPEVFQARGILPAGTTGELHLRSMKREVQSLLEVVRRHIATGKKDEPVDVDLQLETFRLGGKIHSRYDGKCVHFRTANLKAADRLRAWIEHLALCALAEGDQPETVLIGRDAMVKFGRVPSPRAVLQTLCKLFSDGLTKPLRFFPESGLAFVDEEQSGQGDPLTKAKAKWLGPFPKKGEKRRGEKDEVFIARCFDGDSLDEDFAALARVVFGPVLKHSKREDL